MRTLPLRAAIGLALLLTAFGCESTPRAPDPHVSGPATIQWEKWSDGAFDRARREHKFVLLDLEAVWCDWCHVMDEITYADPQVIALIHSKYIAVRVDQDARPDISRRYEDYGWPATVVFNSDASEIVKRQGYIPPRPMARMLQAVIDDPTPGPSVRSQAAIEYGRDTALAAQLRQQLEKNLDGNYDAKQHGWGTVHKFLDWDAIEYSMIRARSGDREAERRARETLDSATKLIDPVWGGIFQYSTDGDWDHPHFEKIVEFQAQAVRIYAMAWAQWHEPAYLKASQAVRDYLMNFMRGPDGAFYTSQDADLRPGKEGATFYGLNDEDRRKLGIPRIDTHVYARENGWVIDALLALYDAAQDPKDLKAAVRATRYVLSHRALSAGGFRHDETDGGGPYLGDTLAMGRALLHLYASTADRAYLAQARAAADFIRAHFAVPGAQPGWVSSATSSAARIQPLPAVDENVACSRFFELLFHYAGNPADRAAAETAMAYLATPAIARSRGPWVAGILLADAEMSHEPLHVTVVGPKSDPIAGALFAEARKSPIAGKRIEWWDPHEPPLPNPDVSYPDVGKPAAFLCTGTTCSSPIFDPSVLAQKLLRLGSQ